MRAGGVEIKSIAGRGHEQRRYLKNGYCIIDRQERKRGVSREKPLSRIRETFNDLSASCGDEFQICR